MIVGSVKEIKIGENRVGLTPYGAHALKTAGHTVLVEKNAGLGSGFPDASYTKAGATILTKASDVYAKSDMIIKVKEPQKSEFPFFRPGLILYTYLHLAAEPDVTNMLLQKKVTSIAYETVELSDGMLPLLYPMSEVAGRMAVHVGAWFLHKPHGGYGMLLGGVPGVLPASVVIFGAGSVGTNAAKMAVGMGARVTVFARTPERLRYLDDMFGGHVQTRIANPLAIEEAIADAALVIGGVLVTGAKAPKLVSKKQLGIMKKGAVIVDVSIDQGGCFETSRPTSHAEPTYEVNGIIHYCVTNMPGAVPYTSTLALTNVTTQYALTIANKGVANAVKNDPALAKGVNTYAGKLTYKQVAEALSLPYTPLEETDLMSASFT